MRTVHGPRVSPLPPHTPQPCLARPPAPRTLPGGGAASPGPSSARHQPSGPRAAHNRTDTHRQGRLGPAQPQPPFPPSLHGVVLTGEEEGRSRELTHVHLNYSSNSPRRRAAPTAWLLGCLPCLKYSRCGGLVTSSYWSRGPKFDRCVCVCVREGGREGGAATRNSKCST